MNPRPISAVLITRDAATHLDAVLAAVRPVVDHILILDSHSTDGTIDIAKRHAAEVQTRPFAGFGPQKRLAVSLARHDWILALDADEVLDPQAVAAVLAARLDDPEVCYRFLRRTYVGRREIAHGAWGREYVARLFHRSCNNFTEATVHEAVVPTGPVRDLPGVMRHYSYASLADIFRPRYHLLKAEQYRAAGRRAGSCTLVAKAAWAFLRSWLLRGGFRDGPAGLVVALSAAVNAVLGLAMASDPDTAPPGPPC